MAAFQLCAASWSGMRAARGCAEHIGCLSAVAGCECVRGCRQRVRGRTAFARSWRPLMRQTRAQTGKGFAENQKTPVKMMVAVNEGTNSGASTDSAAAGQMLGSVSLVALGCAKNTVDAEVMLGDLQRNGVRIVGEDEESDVVIVNTCAFIEDAKTTSIEAILHAVGRKTGSVRGVLVTGCLAQRYASDLADELPEVDAVVGFENYSQVPELVLKILRKAPQGKASRVAVGGANVPFRPEWERWRLTPRHTAYLRAAEGCSHACSFCIIPSFRGLFRSKPWDSVLDEARRLAASGVVELNLIAEDTNQYGMDWGPKDPRRLHDLLYELAKIPGIRWIRLLYCYPSYFSDELIAAIRDIPEVVKYVDIPLQHMSDRVLRAMNRPPLDHTLKILNRIRDEIPDITLRTTFISGFPGETKEDHEILKQALREFRFRRAGIFSYSVEEGTPAALLEDLFVDPDVKESRCDELISIQQEIEEDFAKQQVGKELDVLIDRHQDGYAVGRTRFDAPEIDSMVYVVQLVDPGTMVRVKIVGTHAFDLIGEVL
ncbi:Ribosomal protein S12 methylthiotransferase RimO [Porphyridium purpureum]|uniref:Ribosomal protein S12 methylthiotransferase RimO n=1 Tax=Porphyridium purpureum TaxID=35688 RepID=A0A5J4YVQ9_PORPP|nr:Ribosomal protein S12 methylthiotransferase RimO [Porphyridium purpureum]|eukprot:POR7757..scf227_4